MSEISYKVMNIYEDYDCIIYRTSCDCGLDDHSLELILSIDENYDLLNIMMSGNLNFSDEYVCYKCNFLARGIGHFRNFVRRICAAIKLVFTGRLEQNYDFIFSNEKHIQEFLKAINEGMNKLKANKESSNIPKD